MQRELDAQISQNDRLEQTEARLRKEMTLLKACQRPDTGMQALRDELREREAEFGREAHQLEMKIRGLEATNKDLNLFFGQARRETQGKEQEKLALQDELTAKNEEIATLREQLDDADNRLKVEDQHAAGCKKQYHFICKKLLDYEWPTDQAKIDWLATVKQTQGFLDGRRYDLKRLTEIQEMKDQMRLDANKLRQQQDLRRKAEAALEKYERQQQLRADQDDQALLEAQGRAELFKQELEAERESLKTAQKMIKIYDERWKEQQEQVAPLKGWIRELEEKIRRMEAEQAVPDESSPAQMIPAKAATAEPGASDGDVVSELVQSALRAADGRAGQADAKSLLSSLGNPQTEVQRCLHSIEVIRQGEAQALASQSKASRSPVLIFPESSQTDSDLGPPILPSRLSFLLGQRAKLGGDEGQEMRRPMPTAAEVCHYFDGMVSSGKMTQWEAGCGDLTLHEDMTNLVVEAIYRTNPPRQGKRRAALELMAGDGRNAKTLLGFYEAVHMNDGAAKMAEQWPADIVKHLCLVQDLQWPPQAYDLIFGCWVLCYLSEPDRRALFAGIKDSMSLGGYVILLEPVLDERAIVEEERHPWLEQGLLIREQIQYYGELESAGFDVLYEHRWKRRGVASHDVAVYMGRLSIRARAHR